MEDLQKKIIAKLVINISQKVRIKNSDEIIDKLCSMEIDDVIDKILISLDDLFHKELISEEDVFASLALILQLDHPKYSSDNSLIARLRWLKKMNLLHPQMSLEENKQLLIAAFNDFNKLLDNKFDCYYTGGVMCYLAINHPLERYHNDLDLYINEQQLLYLKQVVDSSLNFHFVSNMQDKKVKDHEYKIVYQDTSLSIGLFLFSRNQGDKITINNYYFENAGKDLFVDKEYLTKEYSTNVFSNQLKEYNNLQYKMLSLESIYLSKLNSRAKDEHDISIIKEYIDQKIVAKINREQKKNFIKAHQLVTTSIILTIEKLID